MLITIYSGVLRVFEISPPDLFPIKFHMVKKFDTGIGS